MATSAPADREEMTTRAPVLVGRGRELELLVRSLAETPSVALVDGQAGIGKTRLIEELISHPDIRGRNALIGHCHPLRDPFPLGSVIEALRGTIGRLAAVSSKPILGALRPLLPDAGDALPSEPAHLGDPAAARHQVFMALAEVLGSVDSPVLVLEDMHWSDEGTCEFLSFLNASPPKDLSLIVTFRSEDLDDRSPLRAFMANIASAKRSTRLYLDPLDRETVRDFIAAILGSEEVSPQFAAHMHERTGGLPFAIEEVLRLLHDRRDVARKDGRWMRKTLNELQVPSAISDAVIARLGHLAPSARRVTEAAAVVDRAADAQTLSSVASVDESEITEALLAALDTSLLRETDDGRYGFQHDLARQAVYESIPLPRRQQMHLRVAVSIESGPSPSPARLSLHRRRAGDRDWFRYSEQAADLAASLGHDAGAARFLQEALTADDLSLDDRVRMASKLGEAAIHGLAHDEATNVLRDLLVEPLPAKTQAGLRLFLARLLREGGDASAAYRQIAGAVPNLDERPEQLARALGILANPWVREATVHNHIEWLRKASEVAEELRDPEMTAIVAVDRVTLLASIGDPAGWRAAEEFKGSAASPAEQRQLVRMCQNAAAAALWLGLYGRARSFVDEGLALSRAIEYPRLVEALETTGMLIDLGMGQWNELDRRARRLVGEAGLTAPSKEGELILGSLLLHSGRLDQAEPLLSGLVATCEAVGLIPVLGAAAAALGRLAIARGEPQEASRHAAKVLAVIEDKQIWVWAGDILPVAVEALLATGATDEAADLTDRIDKGIVERDAPLARGACAYARGLLAEHEGDRNAAIDSYAAAERAYLEISRPLDAASATARRGACLLAAGRDGADLLTGALKTFDDLGSELEGARLRKAMRELGMSTPARPGSAKRGYGDKLSPREEEVAGLAATGLTNRAIADRLFLSHRTVAHHLERAMRKMGVSSRTMLADRLRQD